MIKIKLKKNEKDIILVKFELVYKQNYFFFNRDAKTITYGNRIPEASQIDSIKNEQIIKRK